MVREARGMPTLARIIVDNFTIPPFTITLFGFHRTFDAGDHTQYIRLHDVPKNLALSSTLVTL